MNGAARPVLTGLRISDPPSTWEALGFAVHGSRLELGGVTIALGGPGHGITAWSIDGIEPVTIDGLAFAAQPAASHPAGRPHPNGAIGIDHVVVVTPDFDRTGAALRAAGIELSRIRDAGGFRQGFRRIGPAVLELVEVRGVPQRPARFWGLVAVADDLEALARRLGDRLGTIKQAVQPGRRIATVRDAAGLSPKVAFMTPEAR